MQTKVFKTKELTQSLLVRVAEDAATFAARHGRKPTLAVVLVGSDPASQIYVAKKSEACRAHGLEAIDIHLQPEDGFARLEEVVRSLNERADVDGILVQSPLPKGWDEEKIQSLVCPEKDVDGFHPQNAGNLATNSRRALEHGLPPCTPAGVMEVLRANGIDPRGKHAVVIGRSNIVGKPLALMLLGADATVTICHSKTPNLAAFCHSADILVAAVGKARFVRREHVKAGAVVIDVGVNREERDGKARVVGDVDAEAMMGHAAFLTPVPNGIGPMTITLLIRNTVRAAMARLEPI